MITSVNSRSTLASLRSTSRAAGPLSATSTR
jgi:hypothetical protein